MSGWARIRLVARREINERGLSRAYLISTLVVLAVALVVAILPAALSDDNRPTYDVGVAGTTVAAERPTLAAAAAAAAVRVRPHPLPPADVAEALRSGDVDLVLRSGREVLVRRPPEGSGGLARLAANLARGLGLEAALRRSGADPARARAALAAPPAPVRAVDPAETGTEGRPLAYAGLLLLYIALLNYGSWVAIGVVQEKASRVIEVVLSAVRPRELLTGKALGIGLLGLAQMTVVAVPAAIVAVAVGSADLPAASVGGVVSIVLWFALGFAFYCLAYAAVGSLASRTEDAQTAMAPLTIVVLAAFFAAISALSAPESTLAHVLSFVPPTAPLVMLVRTVEGTVGAAELVAALIVMVLGIVVTARIAGRIYTGAILATGPRLRLRQAWRSAREEELPAARG